MCTRDECGPGQGHTIIFMCYVPKQYNTFRMHFRPAWPLPSGQFLQHETGRCKADVV